MNHWKFRAASLILAATCAATAVHYSIFWYIRYPLGCIGDNGKENGNYYLYAVGATCACKIPLSDDVAWPHHFMC